MALTIEQKAFIAKVGKLAAADMKNSGVLASLTISQAILESGWGKSGLTVKANALFGIKAGKTWKGKTYSAKTQECYDGVNYTTITDLFRAYGSWEESVADHSALLTGAARYKAVVGETDYKKACKAIKAAGYATAPDYAEKLINIIECYGLTEYDRPAAGEQEEQKGSGKMKSSEFIKKLVDVAENHKTLYVMGCFGAPLNGGNVERYINNHSYNKQAARTAMIKAAANKNIFGFDCVNLIKGILWGWCGDASRTYGGATYNTNGVPDINADGMITKCTGLSTSFAGIVPGEAVWLPGHIGVYIGNGKVVECSPAFANKVQITACLNIGAVAGLNGRKWQKHGKLPYITYDTAETPTTGAGGPGTSGAGNNATTPLTLAVGDVVGFTGNVHYTSANAATGKPCKPGKAKVTQVAAGTKHPYHLIAVSGSGSTVYGWVNMACIDGGTAAGNAVLRQGAKVQYSGTLYADSYGGGPGKTVNGTYTVSRYIEGRKCGVLLGASGWVPASACKVIG